MKPVCDEIALHAGQRVWIYSKGMCHCRGSAVIESLTDGVIRTVEKLPEGTIASDLLLDREYETSGDMMREILREFNECIKLSKPQYCYGPYVVRRMDRSDSSFLLEPLGRIRRNNRYRFHVTPYFCERGREWIFNVLPY